MLGGLLATVTPPFLLTCGSRPWPVVAFPLTSLLPVSAPSSPQPAQQLRGPRRCWHRPLPPQRQECLDQGVHGGPAACPRGSLSPREALSLASPTPSHVLSPSPTPASKDPPPPRGLRAPLAFPPCSSVLFAKGYHKEPEKPPGLSCAGSPRWEELWQEVGSAESSPRLGVSHPWRSSRKEWVVGPRVDGWASLGSRPSPSDSWGRGVMGPLPLPSPIHTCLPKVKHSLGHENCPVAEKTGAVSPVAYRVT